MKYAPLLYCLLLLGCAKQLTVDQAEQIATKYGIKADIVWKKGKALATQDGYVISCDLERIARAGYPLRPILEHEYLHIKGYDHCKRPKCLMYYAYNTRRIKVLCGKCGPGTTLAWLFGGINGK